MTRCGECKFWDISEEVPKCTSRKFYIDSYEHLKNDLIFASSNCGVIIEENAEFYCGANFGCIHGEKQGEIKEMLGEKGE